MKRYSGLVLAVLMLAVGCSQEPPPLKVDLSKRENVGLLRESSGITYAYLPQYSHTVSYKRHHLMVEFLRRETGLNIRQVFPDTFDQHMEMVGQGKIDISYSNPFIYVKIAQRYGARAFCRVVEANGRKEFRGQVICRADNRAIHTLADCRQKRWIAVDPTSAGGYLFPLGLFMSHGLTVKDFKELAFSPGPGGKQEKVVLAVYAGKYDIGTIREGTLDVVKDKIDTREIRVIANTPWYPGWVYAARAGLDPVVVKKIRAALLKLDGHNASQRRILAAADIRGVIPAGDHDFDPIRKLAAQIGMRLDK